MDEVSVPDFVLVVLCDRDEVGDDLEVDAVVLLVAKLLLVAPPALDEVLEHFDPVVGLAINHATLYRVLLVGLERQDGQFPHGDLRRVDLRGVDLRGDFVHLGSSLVVRADKLRQFLPVALFARVVSCGRHPLAGREDLGHL